MSTELVATDNLAIVQNGSLPPSVRANAFGEVVLGYGKDLLDILPGSSEQKMARLASMKQLFVFNCKTNPKLLNCDPSSLIQAVFTAASLNLEPNPALGHLYLIPFKNTVQVIPGYKGLLQLVRNSGEVTSIFADAIYENDSFTIDLMNPENSSHVPCLKAARGETIGFYAKAKFKAEGSEAQLEYMSRLDVEAVRNASSGFKAGSPVWKDHFGEMGKKTVLRRLIKRLPISTLDKSTSKLYSALELDNKAYEGRLAYLDKDTGEVIDINPAEEQLHKATSLLEARAAEPEVSTFEAFTALKKQLGLSDIAADEAVGFVVKATSTEEELDVAIAILKEKLPT